MTMQNLLAEIDMRYAEFLAAAGNGRRERIAARRHGEARQSAQAAFAELNGWRPTSSSHGFDPLDGGRETDTRVFDHVLLFREVDRPYRPAAIASQPYGPFRPNSLPRLIGRLGGKAEVRLLWHVPPRPFQSIYWPGNTLFLVLTRPGVPVTWLPEQLVAEMGPGIASLAAFRRVPGAAHHGGDAA